MHSSLVRTFTHSHGQMSFAVYVFLDLVCLTDCMRCVLERMHVTLVVHDRDFG